jgi:predicted nucleic acid-binding protein
VDLALGVPEAEAFFRNPPVDIRLATATYLELLQGARLPEEQRRLKRFVQGYAVLSLGPMASSRAVDLLLKHGLAQGLEPLQSLVAATALAHEIPLVTARPEPYAAIAELELMRPY